MWIHSGDDGAAYVYTSNDPVNGTDPMGLWTHGYCVQASAALFSITGSAGICAVDDSQNNTALAIINRHTRLIQVSP